MGGRVGDDHRRAVADILGSFEPALPDRVCRERAQIGAHYTSKDDILKALDATFVFAHKAVANVTVANAFDAVPGRLKLELSQFRELEAFAQFGSELDPETQRTLARGQRLVRTLNEALGLTSILVSHDVEEVLSISDYAYVIAGGKVLERGTPEAIRTSQSEMVRQFLDGKPDGPVAFHYKASRDYATDLLAGDAA